MDGTSGSKGSGFGSSIKERHAVNEIAQKFAKINPYDTTLVPEILKIEDVNHVNSDPKIPFRQLYGYAISAKRYVLYSQSKHEIRIEKASGHGLGYLLAPKESKKEFEGEETPQWVLETWEFLLRKALKLPSKDPQWLDLPTMTRMVVTTPNVFKRKRPEWLGDRLISFCFRYYLKRLVDTPRVSTNLISFS